MTLRNLIEHPELLALMVIVVRVAYAAVSRVLEPYPRARAVVEGVAALGPDVLRAAQQLGSAVAGRPLAPLDVRAPESDPAALRAQIAAHEAKIQRLRSVVAAHVATAPRPSSPDSAEGGE